MAASIPGAHRFMKAGGTAGLLLSPHEIIWERASCSFHRLPGKTSQPLFPDDTPETCIYSNWSPWSACSSSTCDKGKRMRQRMLKAQLDLSVPCPDTQDFQPCMGPGCSDEGKETTQTSWQKLQKRGLPGNAGPLP